MIWTFDGSMPGLLTAVFEWFERKPGSINLVRKKLWQPDAFSETFHVVTMHDKADRVWKGVVKKLDRSWQRKFYCAWLSEQPEIDLVLFRFLIYIFETSELVHENYGNEDVVTIVRMATSVEREKHRMEAFIRFEKTIDKIYYTAVEPDFNVLPLISKHFKDRYSDQQWIIYDLRRNYGLFYNFEKVEEIVLEDASKLKLQSSKDTNDTSESLYQDLWKGYFKSTNIESRKNTKLHIRHVPRRYHKYLTELQ